MGGVHAKFRQFVGSCVAAVCLLTPLGTGQAEEALAYVVEFGPSTSPTNPHFGKPRDPIPTGYVSLRFRPKKGMIGIHQLQVELYDLQMGQAPHLILTSVSQMDSTNAPVYYRAWKIKRASAGFEARVLNGETHEILALGQFHTAADTSAEAPAAAADNTKPLDPNQPLVVSIDGKRWTPKSAFIMKSLFKSGLLAYALSDQPLTPEVGCIEAGPNFDNNALWWAEPKTKHIALRPDLPLLLSAYTGHNETNNVDIPEGHIELTPLDARHVHAKIAAVFDEQSWLVGVVDFAVCKG